MGVIQVEPKDLYVFANVLHLREGHDTTSNKIKPVDEVRRGDHLVKTAEYEATDLYAFVHTDDGREGWIPQRLNGAWQTSNVPIFPPPTPIVTSTLSPSLQVVVHLNFEGPVSLSDLRNVLDLVKEYSNG